MKEIPLTQGFVATVDDEDYDSLMKHKWHYAKCDNKGYARRSQRYGPRNEGKKHQISMHREIMGVTDPDIYIDHKNNNGLCNERWNLRESTNQQNQANKAIDSKGTSQCKGVRLESRNGTWYACIKFNGEIIHIGTFKIESDAAIAYNNKAKELFGEFANLNIIKEECL